MAEDESMYIVICEGFGSVEIRKNGEVIHSGYRKNPMAKLAIKIMVPLKEGDQITHSGNAMQLWKLPQL